MIELSELCHSIEDVVAILGIEQQYFLQDALSQKSFQELLESDESYVLLAKKDGEVVGYLFGVFNVLNGTGDVLKIVVIDQFQRQGIAEKLMEQYILFLKKKEISEVILEVRESNMKAKEFYFKCGFVKLGERKHFYRFPQEDAWIFSFFLK